MKYSIILVFLLLSMPLVSAVIDVDTSRIHIYVINNISNSSDETITFRVDFNTSKNPTINDDTFQDFTVNISSLLEKIVWTSPDIIYILESNITTENIDFKKDWEQCLEEKIGFERGWQLCHNELTDYKGENTTLCKEDLSACLLDIQSKDIEITGKENTITDLEDEKETTKNSKWFYAVIAFVLGIGAILVYEGKIGKGSAKDKSTEEFNKAQQG